MNGRVVTLGEIMLRLKSPGFERLFQTPFLEATFGGSEANVALSLANFGLNSTLVTALPDNPLADACIRYLRSFGVDTSFIIRQGERMGLYFLEAGNNQRPSNVVYDRGRSAISTARVNDFDWPAIFEGAGWLHISGITPAISASAAELTLHALRTAWERGVTISCDYNYRKKLWQYGKSAPEVMRELVPFVNVCIANEDDCQNLLDIQPGPDQMDRAAASSEADTARYAALAQKMLATFPNLTHQVFTLRESLNANHHRWSAALYSGNEFFVSRRYEITDIVDRVGGGDSFAAGLVYGLFTGMGDAETLEFAVAASCLKHSIPGDANRVTVAEVQRLAGGDASGRVQR